MRFSPNAITKVALSAVLVSTLGFGMIGCSASSSSSGGQTTASSSANNNKYQVANKTVGITETVKAIEVEWSGGQVIVSAVPASAYSFSEQGANSLSDDKRAHYYLENGTLHIRATAPSCKDTVDGKTLLVNVPGSQEIDSITINGSKTNITFNAPGAVNATLKTTEGLIDCTAGESIKQLTLETTGKDINLKVAQALGFTLTANAGGGAVQCAAGDSAGNNTYKNGNGSAKISATTTSASIVVNYDL